MVFSTSGSVMYTGDRRRSKAASLSTCFWYSSKVVAPIHRNSPRASIGFKMLAASIDPPAAPVPNNVWISSMKRTMRPSASDTSFKTAFKRSSNSPRILDPATIAAKSKANNFAPMRALGTSPRIMRSASPSAMAVLPTPGSPTRTGLFFFFRESTWITLLISSSRPITGSSLPASASATRSVAYFSKASYVFSTDADSMGRFPMRFSSSSLSLSRSRGRPCAASASATFLLEAMMPSSKCGTATKESPLSCIQTSAAATASFMFVDQGAF
mmetsp:Transcript_17449/g.43652  ORF Transcript_17449/g.43652 Transcript_17449/m.43652 type:complete len:271 (-) Transcript_17449:245-1057(-)